MKGDLPAQFTGPDDSPGFLLWQVANAWQRRQRLALEDIGLTHVQFVLLASLSWLCKHDGQGVTQAMLARHSRVDEMMTSQVIRTLEKRGAVIRHPHPRDSRAKNLSLTREGSLLLAKSLPLVEKADVTFFEPAGAKLDGLVETLQSIAATVRSEEDGTTPA